jgi:hypothetical protein
LKNLEGAKGGGGVDSLNDIGNPNQQLMLTRGDDSKMRIGPSSHSPNTSLTIGSTMQYLRNINRDSAMAIVNNGALHLNALPRAPLFLNIVSGGDVIGPRGQHVRSDDRLK